jgi:alpha-galactosidase
MLSYDDQDKTLQFVPATGPAVSWRLRLEANGAELDTAAAETQVTAGPPWTLRLRFAEPGLSWVICAEVDAAAGTLSLRSTLENHSGAPITLGRAWPFHAAVLPLGPVTVFLAGMPGQQERRVRRVTDPGALAASKVKNQYFDPAGPTAIQVGFTSFLRADTEVHHRGTAAGVGEVAAQADFAGWQLAPGTSTPVETFTLMVGADPHAQLDRWAGIVAAQVQPRKWPATPLGWVGWSWVDGFNVENFEEVVLRNCAAINRRLAGFGLDYVWVSIGNLPGGQPGAWTGWNTENFPHGPDYLVQRLRELGFKLGLWCGPFWISSHLRAEMRDLEDALLRNPDGSLFVSLPRWNFGESGRLPTEARPVLYALDPTHPKALAFLERAFAVNRERGVRYYMIDFLYAGAGNLNRPGPQPGADHGPLHDPRIVPGPEAFRTALQVIRRAAGPDTYLLASTGPTLHTVGVADGIRTGADFGEGRALTPGGSSFYPATYMVNNASVWNGCVPALCNQAAARYTHRRLYLNDAGNVLTVDQPLPLADARTHATMHALCGGPSMLGDDVDRMAESRLALIKKTLPRAPEVAFAVDLFDSPSPDHPKIFHRRVEQAWGRHDVVAVYNFAPQTLQLSVELTRLGLDAATDYLVWEFWDERYIGRIRGQLEASVPPGTVKVFRLVRDERQPVLLGTDMHVLMGEMEITACNWDAATRTLNGRAQRPPGEKGSVFIHAPNHVRVADPRGKWIAKDGRDQSLIIRCALDFSAGGAGWSVTFADL